jgi:hypothetical protein
MPEHFWIRFLVKKKKVTRRQCMMVSTDAIPVPVNQFHSKVVQTTVTEMAGWGPTVGDGCGGEIATFQRSR